MYDMPKARLGFQCHSPKEQRPLDDSKTRSGKNKDNSGILCSDRKKKLTFKDN